VQKEQEPIAGIRETDLLDLGQLREEGEGRVDGRHGSPRQVEEMLAVVVHALVVRQRNWDAGGAHLGRVWTLRVRSANIQFR